MKCICLENPKPTSRSPPSRGAWIEIYWLWLDNWQCYVAPLAGGVD